MSNEKYLSPTVAVAESIAEEEETDPAKLHPPLHSVIDTDALDQVIESLTVNGCVQFEYQDYEITINSDSEVELKEKSIDLPSP